MPKKNEGKAKWLLCIPIQSISYHNIIADSRNSFMLMDLPQHFVIEVGRQVTAWLHKRVPKFLKFNPEISILLFYLLPVFILLLGARAPYSGNIVP